MAGHSKWSNIKHRKGAQDKKKSQKNSQYVTKLINAMAAHGIDSPEFRAIYDRAKKDGVPNDVLKRTVTKSQKKNLHNKFYEITQGNKQFIVHAQGDNINKLSSLIKRYSNAFNLQLSSCSYNFLYGFIIIIENETYDNIFERYSDYLEDIGQIDRYIYIMPSQNPDKFIQELQKDQIKILCAKHMYVPKTLLFEPIPSYINDLILEKDVIAIYTNLRILPILKNK